MALSLRGPSPPSSYPAEHRPGLPSLLVGTAGPSQAAPRCAEVHGRSVEYSVNEHYLSPVGLCIAGEYSGQIRGNFEGRATRIITTADTPVIDLAMFTSDSTISGDDQGPRRNAAHQEPRSLRKRRQRSDRDLQTIVGGTHRLAGATGALRAANPFSAMTGGQSQYESTVCLPS